jgi:predicted phage terminase large subunit-like protein
MLQEIQGFCTDPLLVWLFPEIFEADPGKYPEWTKSALTVKSSRRGRGSTIATIGTEGEITSQHYDHATYDDVVGKQNSQTKDAREGVVDFYKKSRPLVDPVTSWGAPSTKDFIGTTWHYADLWAFLLERKARHGMELGVYRRPCWEACAPHDPLGAEVPGYGWVRPTFPERFTMAELLKERTDIGTGDFAAQYLLDPVSADAAHFRRESVAIVETAELPPREELWLAMTVDPAISVKAWSDYSALVVGGFDHRGDLLLLEILREKRDERGLVTAIFDLFAKFPLIRGIGFETTGFQQIYQGLMVHEGERRGYQLPILPLARDTTTKKNIRIAGLQGHWEAGQIKAWRGCRDLAALLDEAERFRPDRESQHDDLLDAVVDLWQIRRPVHAPQTVAPAWADPEAVEQHTWEAQVLAARAADGRGGLDRASLLIGWQMHRARQQEITSATHAALGQLDPQFMEIGR